MTIMETIWNITIKFLQFLCWLLEQGTWGVIASLVIILTVKGLIVYAIWKFLKWFLKDAEPIFFR